VIRETGQDEEEVGETIREDERVGVEVLIGVGEESGEVAFGAAADGAGDVEVGGGGAAAGEEESFEGWELGGKDVDLLFECGDVGGVEAADFGFGGGAGGGGDIGAEGEEEGLEVLELGFKGGVGGGGGGEAEVGVKFIEGAEGFEAGVVFGDAGAVEEGGGAVVAAAGVDRHGGSWEESHHKIPRHEATVAGGQWLVGRTAANGYWGSSVFFQRYAGPTEPSAFFVGPIV
jgi:hypothetical protein